MSSIRKKRPTSPLYDPLSAKHQKLEQKFDFPPEDNCEEGEASNSSVFFEENKHERRTLNERKDSYNSENCEISRENDIDVEKHKTQYNLENIKLKELRVILKDIKDSANDEIETLLSEKDLWEVENIIGKKEEDGMPIYLVKWKNWSSEYNTWEPVTNLVNCPDVLEEFENNRLKLLDRFKKKTNFYPGDRDVEEYLRQQLKRNEVTLKSFSVEINAMHMNIRKFFKQKYVKNGRLEQAVKRDILQLLILDSRKKQLKSLEDWENEMNHVTKGKPLVRVENNVDLEGAPQVFCYVEGYLPGNGVIIPDDPPIGCDCKTCNTKTNCCFTQDSGLCPYTSTCKIRVPPGTPIYECNKRCSCNMDCINRVVQRGTEMKLCIFRTSNGRGWGVKTLRSIKKGSFVTQYVGEVITSEEAEKRGKEYDAAGRTYLFDLDYNETEEQCPYTVDAAVYGNVSHFINHSCDPNLAVYGVWINCLDPNLPELALFATRDIKQNEEITFDYTCQSSKNSENSIRQDTSMKETLNSSKTTELQHEFDARPETPESDSLNNKTLCKCGANSCRRYLF